MEDTPVDVQGLYYNSLLILYVGEGDFSFSSSHATRFGKANNIVATSKDSIGVLRKNYRRDAIQNIKNLTDRGAQVIHRVNVRTMAEKDGSLSLLASRISGFDVINYNFPHAGFFGKEESEPEVIRKHAALMQGFFRNAALLLAPGGVVYVAHKCGPAYEAWNLEEIADMHGLQFVGSVPFRKKNFPGYTNRRGSGNRAGETFGLGKAAIYKFALRCGVWIENIEGHGLPTPEKEQFLLQTLINLRSFTEGRCASSKTSLLQAMAAEVARLEKKKLGPEKQLKLNFLKVALKVVPLLVNTLAIHQIRHLQATKSCKKLAKSWSKIQKLALEAMEDEQIIEYEKLEPLAEQDTCGLIMEEHKVVEIYVSDDIANGALGEENDEAFSAFVLDTRMPCCPMDIPEDIHMETDEGVDHIVALTNLGEVYSCHGYQSCDDNQSGMPGLKVSGVASEGMEDVEDKPTGVEADNLDKGIINWVIDMEDVEDKPHGLEADNLDKRLMDRVIVMEDVEDKPHGWEVNSWAKRIINWVIEKILCFFGMSAH